MKGLRLCTRKGKKLVEMREKGEKREEKNESKDTAVGGSLSV